MSNFNIRITGSANLTQAQKQFAALQAQVAELNEEMRKSVTASQLATNPKPYAVMKRAVASNSAVFRDALASTGLYEAQQLRVTSATEDYTKALQKQKVSFRDWFKSQKVASAAYREQLALQQMVVRQLPTTRGGKPMFDAIFPKNVSKDLDTASNRVGFFREQLASASKQLVNWGKNTQWAGRQLMVGFTVPIAAIGALSGKLAYDVDKQMTRVQKVYNTTAQTYSTAAGKQIRVQQEQDSLRAASMENAQKAAKSFGTSMADTLSVEADLAAVGMKGSNLLQNTTEVVKNATLGEIDYQTATKATIAMQQTLGLSQKKISENWAYMNSVENATSLQMKDFATAIPIALGPLKQMGGDVKTLGTLLTGMVSRGISVGKAANGIKAMAQRLIRPSKQIREEFSAITGADIEDIQKRNKGNLLGMLKDIYAVTKNLSHLQMQKVLAGLFGSQQITQGSAMIASMGDLANKTGQVTTAFNISRQSIKQWRKVQEQELERWRQSASGKFKIATETIKAQLAEMGKPFLEAGTAILGVLSKIVTAFNNLPKGVKKGLAIAAIIAAMIGPVVMLTGLFANMIGTTLGFAVALTKLFVKFELLDKESAVAKAAAQLTSVGFNAMGTAASETAVMIDKLSSSLRASAAAQRQVMALNGKNLGPLYGKNNEILAGGGLMNSVAASGVYWEKPSPGINRAVRETTGFKPPGIREDALGDTIIKPADEERAKGMSKSMHAAAVSGGLLSASMAATMISSNKTVDNVAKIVMIASLLGPMFTGAFAVLKAANLAAIGAVIKKSITARLVAARTAAGMFTAEMLLSRGAVAKTGLAVGTLGKGIKGLLGPVGLVIIALTAALALFEKMKHDSQAAAKTYNSQYGGNRTLSKIYGFQYQEVSQAKTPEQKDAEKIRTIANSYRDVIKTIKDAEGAQAKFNQAARIGVQVLATGGSLKQAKDATYKALIAAQGEADAKKIMLRFDGNFDSAKRAGAQAAKSAQIGFDDALGGGIKVNLEEALTPTKKNFTSFIPIAGPYIKQLFGSDAQISNLAKAKFDVVSKNLKAAFDISGDKGPSLMLKTLSGELDKIDHKVATTTGSEKEQWQSMRKELIKSTGAAFGMKDVIDNQTESFYKNADALDILKEMTIKFGKAREAAFLNKKLLSGDITDKERARLKLLNQQITGTKSGVKALNFLLSGQGTNMNPNRMSDGVKKTKEELDKATNSAQRFGSALANAAAQTAWQQRGSIVQDMMTNVQKNIADQTQKAFDNRMQASLDATQRAGEARMQHLQDQQESANNAMQARQERASNALSDRQQRESDALDAKFKAREKAVNNAYDNRIKKVNKEIEAEKKADDIRQKIFQAEIARIDRLNEAANRNIDFNAALNQGKFDEAAKIRNDAESQSSTWTIQDAMDKSSAASQKRQDKLGKRVDVLENEKQKKLDQLQTIEDAEKKALERRQTRESRALQKRQRLEQQYMQRHQQMVQRNMQREVDMNNKSAQKMWDDRKDYLAKALEDFTGYTAMSSKDLLKHIKNWQKKYGQLNVSTKGMFNLTAQSINKYLVKQMGQARRNIINKIEWESFGNKIAGQMIKGSFNMTKGQFIKWIKGGAFHTISDLKNKQSRGGGRNPSSGYPGARHTGGKVDDSPGSRAGYGGAGLGRKERIILAKDDEYVVRDNIAKAVGFDKMDALNAGKADIISNSAIKNREKHPDGTGGFSPMSFIPAAVTAAGMKRAIDQQVKTSGAEAMARDMATSALGMFGPGSLNGMSGAQMKNAQIIANVGSSMGMSKRDIEIAFMAALVESNMRNLPYGDRDSIGMFQQRNSWGSFATRISPKGSSRLFFRALKALGPARNSMGMGEAAQAVQRSAFPGRYSQRHKQAVAIFNALTHGGGGLGGGFKNGPGGIHRPVKGGRLSQGIHDAWTGFPAVDISVPTGTPVYAANDGRVILSKDLHGNQVGGYRSYGRYIEIKHPMGATTLYAHLSKRSVGVGQSVRGGARIGLSGATGNTHGAHLHFGAHGTSPYTYLESGGVTAANSPGIGGAAMLHPEEAVIDSERTARLYDSLDTFNDSMRDIQNRTVTAYQGGHNTFTNIDNPNIKRTNKSGSSISGGNIPNSGKGFRLRTGTFNLLKDNSARGIRQDLTKLLGRAAVLSLSEYEKTAKGSNLRGWLSKRGWGMQESGGGTYGDTAVIWNRKQLKYLRGGGIGINPKVHDSRGGRNRHAAYAELQDRKSGTKFWQVATHLVNHETKGYPRILANQMYNLGKLHARLSKTAPVFMAGDWNAPPSGYHGGKGTNKGFPNLYSNWAREWFKRGTSGGGSHIDSVLTSRKNKFIDSQIVRGLHSDHDALLAQYRVPGLAKGAMNVRWDNTLANLHHGESVLTKDISAQFRQGMANFANGAGTTYHVTIDARGNTIIDTPKTIRDIKKGLQELDRKTPQHRNGDKTK